MSLSCSIGPSSMVLAGNPIKLAISSSTMASYQLKKGSAVLYTGSGIGSFYVFIQDVVAAELTSQLCYNNDERVLIPLNGPKADFTVVVTNAGGESATRGFTAYLGGISRRTLRSLGASNIFTTKFLNTSANFFFTTRTGENAIEVRETELAPIPFIYPLEGTLTVKSTGGNEYVISGTPGAFLALNLYAIRKVFFNTNNELTNMLKVYVGTTLACTIYITPSELSRERYYLRFLNSLGAYEIMEVTGSATTKREFSDEDTYEVYDEVIDDYTQERNRMKSRGSIEVETGYKSEDEMFFLLDLLQSEDVILLGYHGNDVKVHPVADDYAIATRRIAPESIKMTLRFADEEQRFSQNVLLPELGDSRIHTEEFTEQFN